jgi:RNA polymerase sigma-70 factor (ECF subfamily)
MPPAIVQPFPGPAVLLDDDRDAELVQRCRRGDRHAFEELLGRYQRPVFNVALRLLNHREDAKDVTQTVFMNVFRHFDRYDPAQRFFSWVYRIALHEVYDLTESRRPAVALSDELPEERLSPDALAARGESDRAVQGALMALKLEYRTVLVLKHVQGLSYEMLATILDCPVKTVKSRLYTARQALRDVVLQRGEVTL